METEREKAIGRAKWLMGQYEEISPKHTGKGRETVIGDMLADLQIFVSEYGYSWDNVESVKIVAFTLIK